MTREEKLLAYRPRPEHLKLVVSKEAWGVYLSPAANIVDLAIVAKGLGVELSPKSDAMCHGVLLTPTNPATPPPSPEEFARVLDRGFQAGDPFACSLLRRQAR